MDDLPSTMRGPGQPEEAPPSSPPPPPPPLPTPVMPLDYSPREHGDTGRWRPVHFLRRFALAAGVAFMVGAMLMIMFPRHDEEIMLFAFGLGLCLLAVPLPKLPGW